MATDTRIVHRRIAVVGGVIQTADPDWVALNTAPIFGDDFAAGEIKPIELLEDKPIVWAKIFDSVEDDAAPVASPIARLEMEFVELDRHGEHWIPHRGNREADVYMGRNVTGEVSIGAPVVVRVVYAWNLPQTGAIWIFYRRTATET